MMTAIAGLLCGLVFGFRRLISGMTDPAKLLGFLDVFGRWNPTLIFAMAGAVGVSFVGYAMARRRAAPLLAARSRWPASRHIDPPLIGGAVLFGVGWGLAGISGILAGCFAGGRDRAGRIAFILGLVVVPFIAGAAGFVVLPPEMPASFTLTAFAGLLAGFGTRLGGGCTSGHGVCGVARLSPRSLAATAVFVTTAATVVAVMRHVIGG